MSPALTVALLHYAGPPGIGGVEATIAAHARLLAADGQRVRILAGDGTAPGPGIVMVADPLLASRGPLVEPVNRELATGYAGPAFDALVQAITIRLATHLAGVDVVLAHNVLSLHKNLALTAALYQFVQAGQAPPILAWCHDMAWRDPLYTTALHPGRPWELLRMPWPGVHYVTVSDDRAGMLADLLHIDVARVAVIPPGVDRSTLLALDAQACGLATRFALWDAAPLLILPARITRRKNIEQAIRIAAALRRRMPGVRLVVTGPPGPHNPANQAYFAELQRLRQTLDAEQTVLFLYERYLDNHGQPRPVDDHLLAALYRLADGLLFPSRAEGFGMPIAEAGLLGLPIFCADIPPFRETAGNDAVYVDPDGDADTAAAQIAAALETSPHYRLRCRVRSAYTWEAIYHSRIWPMLQYAARTSSHRQGLIEPDTWTRTD